MSLSMKPLCRMANSHRTAVVRGVLVGAVRGLMREERG